MDIYFVLGTKRSVLFPPTFNGHEATSCTFWPHLIVDNGFLWSTLRVNSVLELRWQGNSGYRENQFGSLIVLVACLLASIW